MCGISGVLVKRNPEFATLVYHKLIKASDIRGQDGTGITILRDDEFQVYRWEERARNLTLPILKIGDCVIGQNRYAIFGLDHNNDQPLVSKNFALVHNGVLYEYEKQFEELKLERDLKVDTELILRQCESQELTSTRVREIVEGIKGEAACLVLQRSSDSSFIAFMKNKILFSGRDTYGNIYYFSTLRIKNKVPEISGGIYEFNTGDVVMHARL